MIHYAEVWKINKDSKIPYTDQLVRNIRWSIFTGEVRWTEKLPPIRVLADELGISINTVRPYWDHCADRIHGQKKAGGGTGHIH